MRMTTKTGALDLSNGATMAEYDFSLDEIVHALSHINRFYGHAGQFSVLEHTCKLYDVVTHDYGGTFNQRWVALTHEFAEPFFGDIIRAVKEANPYLETVEMSILKACLTDLGTPTGWTAWLDDWGAFVKPIDHMLGDVERAALFDHADDGPERPRHWELHRWIPAMARAQFYQRWDALKAEMKA